MKKKISLMAAIMALVFLSGCAELVFVKDGRLYRMKDNGDDLQQINPIPALPGAYNNIHRPDVNHSGERVALTGSPSPTIVRGYIWTMDIDGSNNSWVNIPGFNPTMEPIMARWYPGEDPRIAYFGSAPGGGPGIREFSTVPPQNERKICETDNRDSAGFDLNQPAPALFQIIFARREGSPPIKLYRRKVEYDGACTPGELDDIEPFQNLKPDGNLVPVNQIEETLPVVSFSQKLLASAVRWPNFIGIRLRGIGQDGRVGLPATFELVGLTEITGLSFAKGDLKIYLSARVGAQHGLYYIGVKEILEGIANLLDVGGTQILRPGTFSPEPMPAGAGNLIVWPSGINSSTP